MFGLQSAGVVLAYLLCILSAAACVVYGIINWNKGNHEGDTEHKKSVEWQEKESELEEKL